MMKCLLQDVLNVHNADSICCKDQRSKLNQANSGGCSHLGWLLVRQRAELSEPVSEPRGVC